ncbi:MAG: phosphatase PAP2 family protein [Clostridia bacterium]|nr:phosphatase PAP2 family protein [Clostridia bacterium]
MIELMLKIHELRSPLLNKIVEYITISAEETVLILFMCIVYWCISRENGYKLILSIIFASASSAALKLIFKVERPWIKDERIVPIRTETAGGYSMPSGHTQTGASLWFSLQRSFRKTWLTIIAYTMMLLIAFSRVYLGVHTPQDVLAGLGFAVVGVLISHFAVNKALEKNSVIPFLIFAAVATVGLSFFVDEGYYKMTGLFIALPLAFYLENKFVRFTAKTKFFKQILKLIIGFVIVMVFKEGLKLVMPDFIIFDTLRYFFVGIAALYLAPQIFVLLKLSEKKAE